jgi:hypothetical protein
MQESTNTSINPAKRLLEKLKSPFLFLASDLHNPQTPHIPLSSPSRQSAMEIEDPSGGRLASPDDSGTAKEEAHYLRGFQTVAQREDNLFSSLSRKRQIHLLDSSITTTDHSPSRWYQKRKHAAREILELSQGQLLMSPSQLYYHGDDRPHMIVHAPCGNMFQLSLSQLRLEGPEHICPYCHGGLIARIGSVDKIFEYIFKISVGQVLFVKNQLLACSDNSYLFYHLGCRQNFEASFDHVVAQNRDGTGSGCLRCDNPHSPPLIDHFYR